MDKSIAFTLGPLIIRWYGILIAAAFAVGSYLAYREVKRQKLDPDHLLNILLLAIPSAIVGARFYYVVMRWDYYRIYPQLILKTWMGGLAIHGGVIAAALAIWLYCRHKKLNFLRWTDLLAPSLILGQAIGRWGNYFNEEAYGSVTSLPWGILIDGAYRHPTFFYEFIWDLLGFVLLMWLLRRKHRVGSVFAAYLIFYSVGRFFIEILRTDSLMLGPIPAANLVSVLCIALGGWILYRQRDHLRVDITQLPDESRGSRQQKRAEQREKAKQQPKHKK